MAKGWDRYRLLSTIGTGASGTVYVCDDVDLGRRVAIKELTPALARVPEYMARFRQEAQVMAQLDSVNCARIFDFFEQDGRPFLVEEFVDGASLRAVMQSAGRLTPEQCLGVLRNGLSGLGYAHSVGVLHRDVKPENLLVDREGVSKLIDFGQATAADQAAPTIQGTPAYMAPEVVQGRALDARSDIYSAGVMLFEMLAGQLPYSADNAAALMRMHVESPVPDPRQLVPGLPDGVAFLVGKAMTKDPAARHQGALEFYQALETAAVAGYGPNWLDRSSIKTLVGAAAGAAALAASAGGALAAGAGGTGATGAATVQPAVAPAAAQVAEAPVAPAAPVPVASVRKFKIRPLRFALGAVLGVGLILLGTAFGATHGILPPGLSAAGFGLVKPPPGEAAASGGNNVAAKPPPPTGVAAAAANASTTVFVLDISGSMDSPAIIPSGFPDAARLKQRQDDFESLVEQARAHQKVPVGALVTGVSGIVDLIHLQSELQDYLQKQGVDPNSLSKLTALKTSTAFLVDTLAAEQRGGLGNEAGIVVFSTDARQLAPLSGDLGSLQAPIAALTTEGSTDIGDGLKQGIDMLGGKPAGTIVLLTDGWNNSGMTNDQVLSGPVAEAAAKGIPVCTIGLGQSPFDVDQGLLTAIARTTGGGYYFVPDRVSLAADMQACHNAAAGQQLADYRGRLSPGGSASSKAFDVPSGKHRLTVTATSPGNAIDLQLVAADGHVVATGQPGPAGVPGVSVVSIASPPAGALTARVAAGKVDPSSPDFFVNAATDGQTVAAHLDPVAGGNAALAGSLGRTRSQIRLVLTVGALVAGLCILLLTLRGLRKRIRARRAGASPRGGLLVSFVLYVGAVGGLMVLAGAAIMNYLWDVPLIQLPSI